MYATEDVLPATLPRAIPNEPPAVTTAFLWQADYWMVSDLLLAVATANSRDGKLLSVMEAPVKRIESITLEPLGGQRSSSGEEGMPPRARSFTGRVGGGADGLYDIRHAQVTLIVSSERLPEVLDAFSRTNFITVVGVELASVDARAELDRGYFYGPDHVVRATLEIETVWLRSWMQPLMPPEVSAMLTGVEPDPSQAAAGGGGGASAAPPRRQIKARELPAGRRGG
ncbi:hypothetical protein J4558_18530 [Leptolyngbya sp. 15MV]|nr:hypothetical protein J4558_18530 [Leptolyngbya sp. 15MV]